MSILNYLMMSLELNLVLMCCFLLLYFLVLMIQIVDTSVYFSCKTCHTSDWSNQCLKRTMQQYALWSTSCSQRILAYVFKTTFHQNIINYRTEITTKKGLIMAVMLHWR